MKHFFREHHDSILIALAVLFLGVLIGYFSWGIGQVVTEVNRAANAKGGGVGNAPFDIRGAQRLDLRGLIKQP